MLSTTDNIFILLFQVLVINKICVTMNFLLKTSAVPRVSQRYLIFRTSSSSKALNAHPSLGIIQTQQMNPNPYLSINEEISSIFQDINLNILTYGPTEAVEVTNVAKHYFTSQGKV